MQTHTGVAAQMFAALAHAGVNIGMITTSEIKIRCSSIAANRSAALAAVHRGFGLHRSARHCRTVGSRSAMTTSERPTAPVKNWSATWSSRLASMEDIVVSEVQLDRNQSRVTIRNHSRRAGRGGRRLQPP